jgi:hypothetical protein
MINEQVDLGKGYKGMAIYNSKAQGWYVMIRSESGVTVAVTPRCKTRFGAIEVAKSQVRGGY